MFGWKTEGCPECEFMGLVCATCSVPYDIHDCGLPECQATNYATYVEGQGANDFDCRPHLTIERKRELDEQQEAKAAAALLTLPMLGSRYRSA